MASIPHEHYMSIALKEARKALEENEVPIGAVIVSGNQIVGKGHNQVERLKDVTAHAEIIAITAASNYFNNKYLTGCRMYVTIEPCLMCAAAIGWAHIQHLIYSAPDVRKGFTLFSPSPLHPKCLVESGIMDNESSEMLLSFFRSRRE